MGLTIAKGYLLARTPYRIFDEIITILTSNGARIALLALGTRKLQSKNARNLFFGHLLEFSFFAARTSKKVSKLKSVHTLVAVPWTIERNIALLNCNQLFMQMPILTKEFAEFYTWALALIKQQIKPWPTLLFIVQKLFALYNFEFVTDQCVLCGKKTELVTYSLPAGGLICHNCCSPAQRQSIDTKTTQALFALFHSDLPTIVKIFNDRMCRKLIQMLLTTLNYHLGSHFHL